MDRTKRTHESFGMLGFSRTNSNYGRHLFGSSIEHHNTIVLEIHEAEETRDLHNHWYFARRRLIEVEMSPTQFSEAITSMNIGSGIPVTVRYVDDKIGEREECPSVPVRKLFEQEFKQDVSNISGNLQTLNKVAKSLNSRAGGLKVSEKKELCGKIMELCRDLIHNLPFIQKSFNEQMEKSTNEAKGEIDAFMTNFINNLGIEALGDKLNKPKLIE